MRTRSKRSSTKATKQGTSARRVDPIINRPPNADEQSPESLVSEIVHDDLPRSGKSTAAGDRESRIALRAYELAEARGFVPGAALEDWLRAEREIDGRSVKQVPPEDQFTG